MSIEEIAHAGTEYLIDGTGPGLVLMHGTAGDARTTWQPVIESLADQYTVVAPNLPGSGRTVDPGTPLSLNDVSEQIVAVADHAGLDGFHLVGYSLGAAIAAQLAGTRPTRVRSLLLVAGWLRTDPAMSFELDLWQRLFAADHDLFARFVLHTGMSAAFFEGRDPTHLDAVVGMFRDGLPAGTVRHLEIDQQVDLSEVATKIEAASCVVALSDDRIVPTRHGREIAASIAGAELQEVEGGHLFPWEQPDRFLSVVEGFLSSAADERGASAAHVQ